MASTDFAFEDRTRRAGTTASPLIARLAPAAGGVTVEIMTPDGWDGAVDDLALGPARANVFYSTGFARAALAHVETAPGLIAAVVKAGSLTIGFFPGRVALGVFRGWTHPYAPDGAPLLRPGFEAEALAAFLDHGRRAGWIAIHLRQVDEAGAGAALRAHADGAGLRVSTFLAHRRAAFEPLAPEAMKASRVKELRRLARRLAETGVISQRSTAEGWPMEAAVQAFASLERQGWKGRRGTALGSKPETGAFFREMARDLSTAGALRIDAILRDGAPIAAAVTLLSADRAWYWKTAYDETLARFSPGSQITMLLAEKLAADGRVRLIDSCAVPDHPMIDLLWTGRLAVSDLMIAVRPGSGGALYRLAVLAEKARLAARARAKALIARLSRARAAAGE